MALIKKAVDTVNKRVQFPISESCSGITYAFTGGVSANLATISVILVEENQPNKVLYKFQKYLINQILHFALSQDHEFLPFSLSGDAVLSKSKHILVEFDFLKDQEAPTEIQYETVLSPVFSETLVEIKTIPADGGDVEFSTENYNLLRFDSSDVNVITANTVLQQDGKTMPKMLRYPNSYLRSISHIENDFASLVLPKETKVNATSNTAIYLIKF